MLLNIFVKHSILDVRLDSKYVTPKFVWKKFRIEFALNVYLTSSVAILGAKGNWQYGKQFLASTDDVSYTSTRPMLSKYTLKIWLPFAQKVKNYKENEIYRVLIWQSNCVVAQKVFVSFRGEGHYIFAPFKERLHEFSVQLFKKTSPKVTLQSSVWETQKWKVLKSSSDKYEHNRFYCSSSRLRTGWHTQHSSGDTGKKLRSGIQGNPVKKIGVN